MPADSDSPPVPIGRIARAHIPLIALTTIVGLLLGILASTQLSSSSSSTTSILLNPLDGNPFYPSTRGEQLVNMGTEAEALRSEAVAAKVRQSEGSEIGPAAMLDRVSVTNPANTQILDVTFTDDSPQVAAKYSQAFADAYLQYRKERADKVIDEQIAQLDDQIKEAQDQLTTIAGQIALLPNSSPQVEILRQQSQTAANQISSLSNSRTDLTTLPRDPGQVVTPATTGASDSSRLAILLIVIGGLLGAALGLAIAVARSSRDRRIHSVEQLDELGVPVLGTFGLRGDNAGSSADDQIRRIRAALIARGHIAPWVLMVTSSSDHGHAPLVVPELASSFARSGLQTVVVHATLRNQEPSPLVKADAPVGLCQLLLGRSTLSDSIVHIGPMLSAVPVGENHDEVSDLFVGTPMLRLVRDLKDRCDVLILTTDPVSDGTAHPLTRVVDSVLLEVDQHVTTTSQVQDALRTLGILSAPVDGAVLIGPDAEARARDFSPQLTIPQRELLPGAAELLPAGRPDPTDDQPDGDEGDDGRDKPDPEPRTRSGSNGDTRRRPQPTRGVRPAGGSDDSSEQPRPRTVRPAERVTPQQRGQER